MGLRLILLAALAAAAASAAVAQDPTAAAAAAAAADAPSLDAPLAPAAAAGAAPAGRPGLETYAGVQCDPKYTTYCDTLGSLGSTDPTYSSNFAYADGYVYLQSGEWQPAATGSAGIVLLLQRCAAAGFMSCEPWATVMIKAAKDSGKPYPATPIKPSTTLAYGGDGFLYVQTQQQAWKCATTRTAGATQAYNRCSKFADAPDYTFWSGISARYGNVYMAYTSSPSQFSAFGKDPKHSLNLNGIWQCTTGPNVPVCRGIPGSHQLPMSLAAFTPAEGWLWLVLSNRDDAVGQLWRCPSDASDTTACRAWGSTDSKPSGIGNFPWAFMLDTGKGGVLMVGTNDGKISPTSNTLSKCNMLQPSECTIHQKSPDPGNSMALSGMVNLLNVPSSRVFYYVSVKPNNNVGAGGVYACSIADAVPCQKIVTMANDYRGAYGLGTDGNAILYTVSTAPGQVSPALTTWVQVNACIDKTVVAINSAEPVPDADPWDSTIEASDYRASVSGTAVNCQQLPQTVTYAQAVSRATQASVQFQRQNTESLQDQSKLEFKIKTPKVFGFEGEVVAGWQTQTTVTVSSTETTTTTNTDTVTVTGTITNVVAPHSSCPVSGTISTYVQKWNQYYRVNVTYACGTLGTETWAVGLSMAGVLSTKSTSTVAFGACTNIEMPPPSRTCASNPGCPGMIADPNQLNCCPDDKGVYSACCAVAAAHTADPPVNDGTCVKNRDYIDVSTPICPKNSWLPAACCPDVTIPTSDYLNSIARRPPPNGSDPVPPRSNWAVCYRDPDLPQAYVADVTLSSQAKCPAGYSPAPQDMGGPARVGDPPVLTCLRYANFTLTSAAARSPSAAVVDLAVVSARQSFASLPCPKGYAKVPTPLASVRDRGSSFASALCVKKGRARRALVLDSLQTVQSLDACDQINGTVVAGNLNYARTMRLGSVLAPPTFYCAFEEQMP